jgi:hypothetical protein
MKRRSFLTIASAVPIGFGASAAAQVPEAWKSKREEALSHWQEHEEAVYAGTFKSREGLLRLEVALIEENDEVMEKTIQTPDGEETRYTFEGELLPLWLHPGEGMIKRFRFFWDGKEIPVAKRFWNDFAGCLIKRCTVDRQTIAPDLGEDFDDYQNNLDGPKLILSADRGTALIEWSIIDTDACCGHRATMRWMISKNGHIMRHRHTTPSLC